MAEDEGDKGALAVVGGFREYTMRYDEPLRIFFNKGYSPIYMLSHRGMGQSDRLLAAHVHVKALVEQAESSVNVLGPAPIISVPDPIRSNPTRQHLGGYLVKLRKLILMFLQKHLSVLHVSMNIIQECENEYKFRDG